MPTIVSKARLNATTPDILNAIRNSATANYREYVPVATQDSASIRAIGAVIMNFPALQNEFLHSLVNRIGRVILTNKMYDNPWAMFKKGMLEYGETIEEIFVDIAKPFEYDPAVAEQKVFQRNIPEVLSAFHVLNYQKFYKSTIQEKNLRQAFLSMNGVTDLIAKIVDAMYTGANYDEFQTMKYLIAKHLLNGEIYPVDISEITSVAPTVVAVKKLSNDFTFLGREYNLAGVATKTDRNDQYLIVNSEFDAQMDVEVLAAAFHMDKAEFAGHRVLVDSFGKLDTDRLSELFENDPSYSPLTQAEMTALDKIPCVLVDRDWFMIFDNLLEFTEQYNGEGLYWNYWYHAWKTFSISPFANAAAMIPGTPTVTSVTVTPETMTVPSGTRIVQLYVAVESTNFAPKAVNWTVDDTAAEAGVVISPLGTVTIPAEYTGSITATATSRFDSTVSDTATITVSE